MSDMYKEIKSEIKTGTIFFVLFLIFDGIQLLFDKASEKLGDILFGPKRRKSGEPIQGLFPKAGQKAREILGIQNSPPSAEYGYTEAQDPQVLNEPIDFEVIKRLTIRLTILNEMYSQNWNAMSPEEQVAFIMNAQESAEKNALELIEKAGIDKSFVMNLPNASDERETSNEASHTTG